MASPRPLGMLTNALGRATKGLQQGGQGTDSPINGLLYVSGNITGSKAQPTGEVAVRLYDAAVGECSGSHLGGAGSATHLGSLAGVHCLHEQAQYHSLVAQKKRLC